MNRSRGVLLLSLVLAAGVVVAGIWLLGRGSGEADHADVLRASAAAGGTSTLPDAAGAAAPRDPAALEAVPALPTVADGSASAEPALPSRVLRGRVLMADGSALPSGLTVHATRSRPDPSVTSLREKVRDETDEDAEDAEDEAGDEADGDVPARASVSSTETTHAHSTLTPPAEEPAAVAAGEASDQAASAAEAAPAAARREPRWPGAAELRAQTLTPVAEDGSFEMARAPARAVWLAVDDALLYADPAVRVPAGQDVVELRLVRGASISGRISDVADAGVADASIELGTKFDPFLVFDTTARMVSLDVETDADGRYVARQVPAGMVLQLTASAEKGGLQMARSEIPPLAPGEQRVLDLTLSPGIVVAGRVRTPANAPIADAKVHLRRVNLAMADAASPTMAGGANSIVHTDAQGAFRFDSVSEGIWEVILGEGGYRQVHSEKLPLTTGHDVTDLVLVADEGLAVAGQVLDPDGKPIEGARVQGSLPSSFVDMRANLDRTFRDKVSTDEQGRFRIAGFDPGDLQLRVTAAGYVSGRSKVQAGDEHVTVTLEPLASLSGIVVSLNDGEPVPDFRATLVPSGGLFDLADMEGMADRMSSLRGSRSFHDREDGTFTLDQILPGTFDLSVSSTGFGTTALKDVEVPRGGRRGLVVLLPPECVVTGTVASARDGLPVKGVLVSVGKRGMLEAMTEGLIGTSPEATTDEQGAFSLTGLSGARPLTLSLSHGSFRDLAIPDLLLAPGESRDLGRLLLSSGAAVHGRVLDTAGRPAPGVTVMVSDSTGSTMKRSPSDASGHYRVEGLPPGNYNVMRMDFTMNSGSDDPASFMKDLAFQSVSLAENEDKEVDLGKPPQGGTRLSGRVRATGGPVPGALLTVVPAKGGASGMAFASSDKDGTFVFEHVAPGEYALAVTVMEGNSAAAAGQASSPVSERLTIGGLPEQHHDIDLPGGELHGTVESAADGKLVPGVRVVLERLDAGRPDFGFAAAMNGRVGESYTDAQGAFRFRFLPSGTYALVAGGQNVVGMGAKGWALTRLEDLSVTEGGPGFGVRVKVKPAGGIEGVVRTSSGQPLSGVAVWLADGSGAWQSTFSEISSNSTGAYSAGALQEGSWTLAFRDGSHALKLVSGINVLEGEITPLDVVLKPGVALQLVTHGHSPNALQTVLTGPDGPMPTGLSSIGEVMAQTDLGAALKLGVFAPGTYHLSVMSGGVSLLDTQVTLTGGSGPEVVELEP